MEGLHFAVGIGGMMREENGGKALYNARKQVVSRLPLLWHMFHADDGKSLE